VGVALRPRSRRRAIVQAFSDRESALRRLIG
jgi:hypothetical protein